MKLSKKRINQLREEHPLKVPLYKKHIKNPDLIEIAKKAGYSKEYARQVAMEGKFVAIICYYLSKRLQEIGLEKEKEVKEIKSVV